MGDSKRGRVRWLLTFWGVPRQAPGVRPKPPGISFFPFSSAAPPVSSTPGVTMQSITIDGVEYEPKQRTPGTRHIVVLDRGWVFVGDLTKDSLGGDESWRLTNCANVRKWATGGFGGMCKDPTGSGVVLDPCADLRFAASAPLFTVPVVDGWGE